MNVAYPILEFEARADVSFPQAAKSARRAEKKSNCFELRSAERCPAPGFASLFLLLP
jgi:hypothetical protein